MSKPEPKKPGRKRNPDCPDCKPRQVYCSAEDVLLCRSLVKLSKDQKAYVAQWIAKGAFVKGDKKP